MLSNQLPDSVSTYSIRALEARLGIPRANLRSVASLAGAAYHPFNQLKRSRPFQKVMTARKLRKIDNPADNLKWVQTRIYRRILRPLTFPPYLRGGIMGSTIIDNVMMHVGARTLVTLDIKAFFPSIDNRQVFRVWREMLGFSGRVSNVLTKLTTFERRLPQGAPTSALLANLVLHSMDGPIRAHCEKSGITYSTWIDDLAFSGDRPQQIIQTVTQTLSAAGFGISHRKLRIMGPGDRKLLVGIVLNQFPNIRCEYIAQVRSGIHKLRAGLIPKNNLRAYIDSLEGKIRHVATLAPTKSQRLLVDLALARGSHASIPNPNSTAAVGSAVGSPALAR